MHRADIAVVVPDALSDGLSGPTLIEESRFAGAERLVRRSDGVVRAVVVGGRVAFRDGELASDLGVQPYGRFLRTNRTPS